MSKKCEPCALTGMTEYDRLFRSQGFEVKADAVFPEERVFTAKSGLTNVGNVPLAMIYTLNKRAGKET